MKKRSFIIILTLLAIILSSCAYKYEKFHTDDNKIGKVSLGEKELTAYFFTVEEGGALFELCNSDGKMTQSFTLPESGEYYASLDFEYASDNAAFQDMNFDGFQDLYIPCSVTTANLEGMAWLWNNEKGEFVLSEELSKLYELTVYPDEELITSQDYSDPEGILCKEFKWKKGKLTQVGEYTVITN